MDAIKSFFGSSIGMKVIMALTGAIMVGFVIGHLTGNLLMFAGQDSINEYAAWLHSLGAVLYVARAGLLVALVAHVFVAIRLSRANRAARPEKYAHEQSVPIDFASKYTLESGLVIFTFIVIHLLHYTFQVLNPEYSNLVDGEGRFDVYSMVVMGFQDPVFAGLYIFSMLILGLHLSHAVHSALQTIGIGDSESRPKFKAASNALGWGLAFGFISIPVGVLAGIIQAV